MTSSSPPPIVDEAEVLVRRLAQTLTRPRTGECLCCYVVRMLEEYGCDETRRHAVRYRDAVAPRATAVADRLRRVGAYCDCELFLNGYELRADRTAREAADDEDDEVVGDPPAVPVPPCAGVRRGSIRPCVNWVRLCRGA